MGNLQSSAGHQRLVLSCPVHETREKGCLFNSINLIPDHVTLETSGSSEVVKVSPCRPHTSTIGEADPASGAVFCP